MVKIQEVNGRLSISLPKQIARIKGWQKGHELVFNIDVRTGKIMIDKIEEVART